MKNIYEILNDLKIEYIEHHHPAVYTCEQADLFYKDVEGGKSKNLFLRNAKGDKHSLVVTESHKTLDLKKLAELLGEKKISFASPERLKKYLGLDPGSVSPFGLINDSKKEVVVVIDSSLLEHKKLHYHPNINTSTLEITTSDLKRFLDFTTNKIIYLCF